MIIIFRQFLLALSLVAISSNVSAGTIGDLTYELWLSKRGVTITRCNQTAVGHLVIPAEIEGAPVIRIAESAFRNCENLTSITIPDSVKEIQSHAFMSCTGLTSIDIRIPSHVVFSIGERAFFRCRSLGSITIPDNVNKIGDGAFNFCTSMNAITIPTKFHTASEAKRLGLFKLYPTGFYPQPEPRRALATPIISNGFVTGAIIRDQGLRYVQTPTVTITGGGGSGAKAVAILNGWSVIEIKINNAGIGYTSMPTITIEPPSNPPPTQISFRMVPAITVTGETAQTATIEVSDTLNGPWTEWRTVVIGEEGTTEVDLDEGEEQRFYRVMD